VLPIVRGWEAPDGGVLSLVNVTKRHAAAILNATTTSPNPIGTLLNETKKTVSGKEKYVKETLAVAFGKGNTTTLLNSITLGAGPLPFDMTCVVDPETGSLVGLQKAPAGTSLCGAYGNKVTVPTSKGFISQIKVSRSKEKEGDGTKEQGRVERKSSRERTTTERLDQNGTSREAYCLPRQKKSSFPVLSSSPLPNISDHHPCALSLLHRPRITTTVPLSAGSSSKSRPRPMPLPSELPVVLLAARHSTFFLKTTPSRLSESHAPPPPVPGESCTSPPSESVPKA